MSHIDRKRALLKLSLLGVKSNIYRPYLASYLQRSGQSIPDRDSDGPTQSIEIDHTILLNDGMDVLETCFELQRSIGTSAKGFPVLSIVVMEVSCLLAIFLISSISISMIKVREDVTHDIY